MKKKKRRRDEAKEREKKKKRKRERERERERERTKRKKEKKDQCFRLVFSCIPSGCDVLTFGHASRWKVGNVGNVEEFLCMLTLASRGSFTIAILS